MGIDEPLGLNLHEIGQSLASSGLIKNVQLIAALLHSLPTRHSSSRLGRTARSVDAKVFESRGGNQPAP